MTPEHAASSMAPENAALAARVLGPGWLHLTPTLEHLDALMTAARAEGSQTEARFQAIEARIRALEEDAEYRWAMKRAQSRNAQPAAKRKAEEIRELARLAGGDLARMRSIYYARRVDAKPNAVRMGWSRLVERMEDEGWVDGNRVSVPEAV